MKTLLWICIAVTLSACATQPAADRSDRSNLQRTNAFQSEVERIREQYGFPGMTAAYVLSDGTRGSAYAGQADVEAGVAMKDRPRMLAASIGKSFVSATCISLAMENRLALDEPVSRWLGKKEWFARLPNHETITLRHLLTHSAGIPDHVYMEEFQIAFAQDWQASTNAFPPERLVGFVLDKPALFPAGQGWAYSDTGYILLGMVIEEVTGNAYYDEVRARFLNPLKLSETSPSDRRDLDNFATGYLDAENPFGLPAKSLDDKNRLYLHPGIEWTGGGLVSSSRDLAHWGAALFSGKAMSGDYLSEVLNAVAIDPKESSVKYGAGVAIVSGESFGPVYGHAGWIPGYISSLRYYSEIGVTIAFQINTDSGVIASDKSIAKKIEERLVQVVIQSNH